MDAPPSSLDAIGNAIQSCRRCPIGCNGTSAARGLLGKTVAIGRMRGRPHLLDDGVELWITAHPSYLLRLKDEPRVEQEGLFAQGLRQVASRLAHLAQ